MRCWSLMPEKPRMSDKVIAAIRQISNKPFRTLISTNFDADHVGGNEKVAKSGSQIGGTNGGGSQFGAGGRTYRRLGRKSSRTKMCLRK